MKKLVLSVSMFLMALMMSVPVLADEAGAETASGGFPWWATALIVSLIVGFVVSGIINLVMRSKLKSVHANNAAENYVVDNSLDVTSSSDIYLYTKTTSRAKPKPQNNSNS